MSRSGAARFPVAESKLGFCYIAAVRKMAAVVLLVMPELALLSQQRPAEWPCRTHSGKGDRVIAIPQSHTLQWFRDHLADFDSEIAWRVKNDRSWSSIGSAVTKVGRFH